MQIRYNFIYFLRTGVEFVLFTLVFIASIVLSIENYDNFVLSKIIFLYFFILLVWYTAAYNFGLYDEYRSRHLNFEITTLLKTINIHSISIIIILYFFKETSLPRTFILYNATGLFIVLGLEKFFLRKIFYKFREKGENLRSIIIVGAGKVGKKLVEVIDQNPHSGYNVVGFLDDEYKSTLKGKYLGKIEDLDDILSEKQVDNVTIALPIDAISKLEEVVHICNKYTTRVNIIPDYFKFMSSNYNISMFGPLPIISVREDRLNEFHWYLIKQTFDTVFSTFCFIFIFTWFWPIIAIAIKLDSKGPVFYRQARWGRNNKKFYTYKFRSMVPNSKDLDENGNFMQATKDDPRITRVGEYLRKTNLDELPQFWNVIKGEMSVVGPRPHALPLHNECKENIKLYMIRQLVKPGITGWAQVNGFRGETKEALLMQKRIDHDVWYIENWSLLLDVQICLLTAWHMIKGDPNAY